MGAYEQKAYGVSANPIIGGVQYFHQTTKPTIRPSGDALVVGDRWWKTDDGTEWSWNGTYWLSQTQYEARARVLSVTISDNLRFDMPLDMETPLFFEKGYFSSVYLAATNPTGAGGEVDSSTNYWQIDFRVTININTTLAVFGAVSTQNNTVATNTAYTIRQPLGFFVAATDASPRASIGIFKVGTPPNLQSYPVFTYRKVYL